MKLLFIMFPGAGVIKKGWDHYYINNKIIKITNFITELKKLGDIYFYDPIYYNLSYYKGDQRSQKWYNKNIDFTKEDYDVDKVCTKIYNDVKDFDGKLVLLGHSIGSYFVYYFSQKYASKCLFGIIIDGTPIDDGLKSIEKSDDIYYKKINKYTKYDNDDINKLIKKTKEGHKNSMKILKKIYIYNIVNYSDEIKKIKKFKIPMIFFRNYELDCKDKIMKKLNESAINEIKYIRENNNHNHFKIVEFINKTHYPHQIDESKDIILENIKLMIYNLN